MIRQRVREQFGAHARNYVTSASHVSGADLDRLVELAAPTASDLALDVSTGGGHVALALAPHVARVVASDLTPSMLLEAREFLTRRSVTNADYVIADAGSLPFLDATFDLVTVRIAPHHYPDAALALREMARVLKPSGRLVIVDNVAPADPRLDALLDDWERRRDPSHVRSYTVQEWRAFLAAAGLRVTHEEVGRKDLAYQPWAERIGMTPNDIAKLAADMLATSRDAHAYFALTERDGQLAQWTMEYAIFRAERDK
jgi:ubiquinone/menaquinone biosynthesis C-methylase UbiE